MPFDCEGKRGSGFYRFRRFKGEVRRIKIKSVAKFKNIRYSRKMRNLMRIRIKSSFIFLLSNLKNKGDVK